MRRPMALPAIAVALVALGLSAASAGAETVHVFSQTIAGNELAGTALNTPKGVAVDGSSGPNAGFVYVADSNNNRIVKFNPAGQFQLMWGISVNEGSGDPNVCTNAGAPTESVNRLRALVPGSTIGSFSPPSRSSSTQPPAPRPATSTSSVSPAPPPRSRSSIRAATSSPPTGPAPRSQGRLPFLVARPRWRLICPGISTPSAQGTLSSKWDEDGVLLETSSASPRPSYFQIRHRG